MNNRARRQALSWALVFLLLTGGQQLTRAASAPSGLEPDEACLDCHAEMGEKKHIHPATEDGAGCATLCHQQTNPALHAFAAQPAPIAALCLECHDNPVFGKHRHMPAADGDCIECHDPHQSEQKKLLNAPAEELCLQCHDQGDFSDTVVHGPVAAGDCAACHNPHAAEQARMLRDPIPALCWRCHDKAQTDADGVSLPATKPLFESSEAQHHSPFAAGDCTECHLPHTSTEFRLLAAPYPKGPYQTYSEAAYELCLNCHEAAAAFSEPRTLTATAFRNGNLNLHYRHVNKDKGRTCRTCHTPHGGYQPRLITGRFRFGERTLGLSFKATDSGGSCTSSCHIQVAYDRQEPAFNALRTSPRPPGQDATPEELQNAGDTGLR